MSFSKEMLKGSYKSNKTQTTSKRKKKQSEDDILPIKPLVNTFSAPIKTRSRADDENATRMELINTKPKLFDDGYDFGDVSATILTTAGDSVLNVGKGIGRFAEGVGDAINYGVAGVVEKIGDKDLAEELKKQTQKSLVDDSTKKSTKFFNQYSVAGRTTDAILEGVGQAGATMAMGGLGKVAGLGAKGVSALTTGATAVSGYGSGMSEAYQNGATDEEAVLYGVISGGAEALTEALFGGMGKGVNALGFSHGLSSADDMLAKKITERFSSQIAANFVEFGVKAGAEGVEEVLSGVAQAVGKKLTYMSEKDLSKILKDENLLEQFIVGTVTSGFMQSGVIPGTSQGSLKEAVQSGTDFISGLTSNEQAVVDMVYNDEIAKAEKDGKKLSGKEKSKIYDRVLNNLEKGYIDIDTIESVLGGETYDRYKKTADREDALFKEYEELGEVTGATLKQQRRYGEISKMVEELKSKSQRSQLKSQLSEEVFGLAKDSKLIESYNEKTRRSQHFEADLSQYNEKQRETVKKAIDSGILNNTNRTREFVDMLAKISADKGVLFDFTNNEKLKNSSFAVEGKTVNGYKTDDGNVALNIDSAKSLNSVVGHEITHILEGTELYSTLQEVAKQYATAKGEYGDRMIRLRELYTGVYKGEDFDARLREELTADIVGDYLFTNSDFINNLSTEQPGLFKKIYNEIKYLCKVASAGSKEARALEKVKKTFEDAWKQNETTQKNTTDSETARYSLNDNLENVGKILYDNNNPLSVVNRATSDNYSSINWVYKSEIFSVTENKLFHEKISEINQGSQAFEKNSRDEYMLPIGNKIVFTDGNYESPYIREIVEVLTDDATEYEVVKETVLGVENGKLEKSEEVQVLKALFGNGFIISYKSGANEVYEWENGKPKGKTRRTVVRNYLNKQYRAGNDKQGKEAQINDITPVKETSSKDGVFFDGKKQYSLSDSNGRELSTGQQDFFRLAKTRDEEGRLKPFYHGTGRADRVGTVFRPERATSGPMAYFTDNPDIAGNYAREKKDTSISYDSDYDSYETQFRVNRNGKDMSIVDLWNTLSMNERNSIKEKAKHITMDDNWENVIYSEDAQYGLGNFDVYELNRHRGNVLHTLVDSWLTDGNIYGEEHKFLDVLNLLGIEDAKYMNPDFRDEKVYQVYLNITNPFDTSDISAEMLEALREAAKNADYNEGISADLWDKRNISPEDWIERLEDDIENGTTHTWTSIPDFVTDTLKAHGYDGIFDTGGKGGGESHTVAIPFYSEQVKNVDNLNPTTDIDIRYSLSKQGSQPTKQGNYNVTGEDIRFTDDIAPVKEDVAKSATTTTIAPKATTSAFPDDILPLREDEANAMLQEQNNIAPLTDADVPPEFYAPDYDTEEYVPESPLDDRDIYDVGSPKVKAYMYENPEVKPYFQMMAESMLADLTNTTRGERTYNEKLHYESGGELGWMGTKRHTSPEIANLLDSFKYTYKQIEDGLNAIIQDHGAENNAVSKRIEFALDEMLREGYTDFYYGEEIPPNQDYINLLRDKEITEYSDEAFNYWVSTLKEEDYKSPETAQDDIVPVRKDVAPVKKAETNKPTAEAKVAQILTKEPESNKRKRSAWSMFKTSFIDKASPFETLSLKTGNREVDAKFNSIRYADRKAQNLIGKGAKGVKALNDIQADVEEKGLTQALYEYLYHMHNVDRMTLADRFEDVPNKAVFGDSVTARESQAIVSQYEKTQPKLKQYAQDIYNYNKHLRNLLVENGVISKETANLWEEMYPHYVPVRRADDGGLNINVPLDSRRTGINAPVKKAKGGNTDILPLFDTMAQRTLQTYKAIAKNRFGVELKNTLGTTIEKAETSLDEVIDGIETHEDLLQKGKNGKNPTFTVFENGEKVTFEITDEMYDAMKPTSEKLAYTSKVANKISNATRGVLTEYNPTFMLTNAIKDAQDVLINSQHPLKTYKNFAKASKELASKGKWYTEYMENGGEENTYFDKETNTFNKEKGELAKVIGFPLEKISEANNFIEKIPRLAEYIASRETGRSIDVSMLDAARVTTNFSAGGDVTKFLNRNGATFLNASVQGAAQQVRNVREAKANGIKGWIHLASKVALAGLPALFLNGLLWDDDEDYEELSDYVKQNYYVVAKFSDGKFVRIPKGRTMAVIQDAFTQVWNAATGDDEVDLQSFLDLAFTNLAPNNPIDNNIIAPIMQVKDNKTWYGDDLVPTRLQDVPAAEQYDESTDIISKWLGEKLNYSPYKINYLLNQYSGGVGDILLPIATPKAESEGGLPFIAPLRDKFTTDSVLKNQNTTDFYNVRDELTVNANSVNATDEDVLKSKYFNSVGTEIGELYKEKREIQNSDLSDELKFKQVRDIQKQINEIAENALNTYENVNINGKYANIGDKHYRLDDEDKWQKITDEQLEKQNEVIGILGITPSQYWSNKAEYDMKAFYPEKYAVLQEQGISVEDYKENYEEMAHFYTDDYSWASQNPEKYTLSKAITSDVTKYKQYTSDLSSLEADKDSNGKSISGSLKAKKKAYIWGLDIDDGAKYILFKSQYNADDTYNREIVVYLDNKRKNAEISWPEMVTILEELDFKVESNGRISW